MPTIKPRFTITLTPETYRVFDAFTSLAGVTKSDFIEMALQPAIPQLEKLSVVMQQAKRASPEGLQLTGLKLQQLLNVAASAQSTLGGAVDLFVGPDSPPSNRGSQKLAQTPKKATQRPQKAKAPPSALPSSSGRVVKLSRRPRGEL